MNGYGYLVALTGVTPMAMGYPMVHRNNWGFRHRFFASPAGSEPGK